MPKRSNDPSCEIFCFNESLVKKLKQGLPERDELELAERFFSALGNTTRLRILCCLTQAEELCVCDIANALDMNLSTISHQLRYLREAGMVVCRAAGKMAFYRLSNTTVPELLAGVLACEQNRAFS